MSENPQPGQEAPQPPPTSKLWFHRLNSDYAIDEVRFVCVGGPSLRLVTRIRYKTSGLSGDEWRTSVMVQKERLFTVTLPPEPPRQFTDGSNQWEDFDGAYLDLRAAMAALYPGVYGHPELHQVSCASIDFLQKGYGVYRSTYGDKPLALLAAAGHAAWALIIAGEQGLGLEPLYGRRWSDFCFQPGCPELATVTFGMRKRFCSSGHEEGGTIMAPGGDQRFARRFCQHHARRGDCGLDDADANYFVIDGEVTAAAGPRPDELSPASFAGVVDGTDPRMAKLAMKLAQDVAAAVEGSGDEEAS